MDLLSIIYLVKFIFNWFGKIKVVVFILVDWLGYYVCIIGVGKGWFDGVVVGFFG